MKEAVCWLNGRLLYLFSSFLDTPGSVFFSEKGSIKAEKRPSNIIIRREKAFYSEKTLNFVGDF